MWRYIVKRLFALVIVLLCVAVIIFCVLWFMPGDPAEVILGLTVPEADREALRVKMGWNDPFLLQLGRYLRDVFLHLDFGESYQYKVPVTQGFMQFLPRTLTLGLISVFIQTIIGIPLGVSAAIHRNTLQDQGLLVFAMVFISVPQFWFALMMVVLFSVKLGWLPAYGIGGFKYYILPCLCILLGSFSGMARSMRSSMLEVIRSDFVMAAKAQGFSKNTVYYRHALPNALIPIITQIGGQFANALGGTMILETIFSIPGMGLYIQGAITARDVPIVTGSVVFLAIWFCLVMLAVDILYAVVDPRIKAQYEAQGKARTHRKGAAA